MNPAPFDAAAATYDTDFTDHRLARWLREMVWAHLAENFPLGSHVLELGCGTGEDAVWLAQRGMRVTATDASEEMLDIAKAKVESAGLGAQVDFQQLDLNALDHSQFPIHNSPFPINAVFSNFGPLNCTPHYQPLAEFLAARIPPGGKMVFVVMGPFCPWEIAWHLARGRVRGAFRRWRGGIEAHAGGGHMVRVWYPSPARLRAAFAPHFRHVKTVGIGTLLPPSYLRHWVDRWPGVFERLAGWDRRLGRFFPFTWLNDHYLIVFERAC